MAAPITTTSRVGQVAAAAAVGAGSESPQAIRRPATSEGMSWSQVAGSAQQQAVLSGFSIPESTGDYMPLELPLVHGDAAADLKPASNRFDEAYGHALTSPLLAAHTRSTEWPLETSVYASFATSSAASLSQSVTTTPDAFGEAAARAPRPHQQLQQQDHQHQPKQQLLHRQLQQQPVGLGPPGLSNGASASIYSPVMSPWQAPEPICLVMTQPSQAGIPFSVQELGESGTPVAQV